MTELNQSKEHNQRNGWLKMIEGKTTGDEVKKAEEANIINGLRAT